MPKGATKSLQFIVTLEGVPENQTRNGMKERVLDLLTGHLGPQVQRVTVARYNQPLQVRRGLHMQKVARQLITNAINPERAAQMIGGNGESEDGQDS